MISQIIGWICIVFAIFSFIYGVRKHMNGEIKNANWSELFVCLYLICAAICFK